VRGRWGKEERRESGRGGWGGEEGAVGEAGGGEGVWRGERRGNKREKNGRE